MALFEEELEEELAPLTKDRRRAARRKKDVTKALRKYKISKALDYEGRPWYGDKGLHAYSKGKIHCSCPLCAFHGTTMQDQRRLDEMAFEKETVQDELWDAKFAEDDEYAEWLYSEYER